MTTPSPGQSRVILQRIAHRVMIERGLEPDFSPAALLELAAIHGPAVKAAATRDLRALLWCSIDNDDSLDLDQLSVAEALRGGEVKLLVAIADVAALVAQNSAIDAHARENTTSVYTAGQIFPGIRHHPDKPRWKHFVGGCHFGKFAVAGGNVFLPVFQIVRRIHIALQQADQFDGFRQAHPIL